MSSTCRYHSRMNISENSAATSTPDHPQPHDRARRRGLARRHHPVHHRAPGPHPRRRAAPAVAPGAASSASGRSRLPRRGWRSRPPARRPRRPRRPLAGCPRCAAPGRSARRRRRTLTAAPARRPAPWPGPGSGRAQATSRTTGTASTAAGGHRHHQGGRQVGRAPSPGSPSTAPRIAYAPSPTAVAPAATMGGSHHELRTRPRVARPGAEAEQAADQGRQPEGGGQEEVGHEPGDEPEPRPPVGPRHVAGRHRAAAA